jgi:hypothetical protein
MCPRKRGESPWHPRLELRSEWKGSTRPASERAGLDDSGGSLAWEAIRSTPRWRSRQTVSAVLHYEPQMKKIRSRYYALSARILTLLESCHSGMYFWFLVSTTYNLAPELHPARLHATKREGNADRHAGSRPDGRIEGLQN